MVLRQGLGRHDGTSPRYRPFAEPEPPRMIRRVLLPGTGIETASLGSRISPKVGLDALARAHEAGVAWYDLAPAYGAGEAESIFSRFLAGRRERLSILTKVGLAPPR